VLLLPKSSEAVPEERFCEILADPDLCKCAVLGHDGDFLYPFVLFNWVGVGLFA